MYQYEKWNYLVDSMQFLLWYVPRELVAAVTLIRKMNYLNEGDRSKALEELRNLSEAAPFSRVRRFADGYFLMDRSGELGKTLVRLQYLLEGRDLVRKGVEISGPLDEEIRICCAGLLEEIRRASDVYDRRSFEKKI